MVRVFHCQNWSKKADLVICSMVENVLDKYHIPKFKILPVTNGVDISEAEKIINNSKRQERTSEIFNIVYVGDMTPSRPMNLLFIWNNGVK